MTIAGWVEKYGKITAYTTAVVILTAFFIRFDGKFSSGNKTLEELSAKVSTLQTQVLSLQDLVRDREKYDRWRRAFNARMRRAYNKNGWEYEEVE